VKDKVEKEEKKRKGVKRKERYTFTPSWHMPVVLPQICTDDVQVRRFEYLDAMTELSGSNEGSELESLSNANHEQFKNHAYVPNVDGFEETDGDFLNE